MAQRTRAQVAADIASKLATNGTGAITAALLREVVQDLLDSAHVTLTDGPLGASNLIEIFTAGGVQTAWALQEIPADALALVSINGVVQEPVTDYSITAATLTFVTPPQAGDKIVVFYSTPAGPAPAGGARKVQFYDDGVFGGAANVEIDGGNLKLLPVAAEPATPTDGLLHYVGNYAGRLLPKIKGPSGIDTALQVGLHGNSVFLVSPANGTTAPGCVGGVLTTAATISHQQTIASANRWLATRRSRFQTSGTAGNATGARTAYTQWYRGNAAGFGGFFFRGQLGMNINLNGGQKFVGLCSSTGLLGGDPSALTNMCGMGYDAGDASTGNWFFMINDGAGTATKIDLGAGAVRNTTHGYDLIMYMRPNSGELLVRIENLHTGNLLLDTAYTADVPAANVGLALKAEVRNGAVAANDNLEFAKIYIESDF